MSSDPGPLESKLHLHLHKPRPASNSPDGLNHKHAFDSGKCSSTRREQSFSLEANKPELKSHFEHLGTLGGKGNESVHLTTSQTFSSYDLCISFNRQNLQLYVGNATKKKKKWDQRYSLVLGMAFVFNLKFWTFDPFGTIAHEEKNGRNIKSLALLS